IVEFYGAGKSRERKKAYPPDKNAKASECRPARDPKSKLFFTAKSELYRGCTFAPCLGPVPSFRSFPATDECVVSVSIRGSSGGKSRNELQGRLSRHGWRP